MSSSRLNHSCEMGPTGSPETGRMAAEIAGTANVAADIAAAAGAAAGCPVQACPAEPA